MTISKGTALTITTGGNFECVAAFSSSEAGAVYRKPGDTSMVAGFLLDISGTTITKAGSEANLFEATVTIQRMVCRPVSSTKLRAVIMDNNKALKVFPITKTATELVGGAAQTLTLPDTPFGSFYTTMHNWDGDSLIFTLYATGPIRWYLTLADDSSQGNVVEFSNTPAMSDAIPAFAPFNSTTGIMIFGDFDRENVRGVVLTKSGLTLSAGTPFTIDTTNFSSSSVGVLAAGEISSTRIAAGYIDVNADRRLRTVDSPTTVNGEEVVAASDTMMWLERFHAGSVVAETHDSVSTTYWSEFEVAGAGTLTHTNTLSESGGTNSHLRGVMDRLDNSRIIAIFGGSGTMKTIIISTDVSPPGISSDEFTAAPMVSKPCDVDSDGTYIYIGVLASDGTPILIQFATALNADGSVVFNPGSGDNIGVECSRGDADEITIAGQFDTTNVVERSEDAGASFSVIDDATIGGISAFRVGPDSDDRILVFDEDNSDLLETVDAGTNWTTINASVTEAIKAIGRLGVDVQQVAFGNSSGDSATITHSMSSGADIEELTGGDDPNSVDVSGVIIN